MPAGLANRSSAGIRHTVTPGSDLSTHVIPSVSSQLGGTWTAGAGMTSNVPRLGRTGSGRMEGFGQDGGVQAGHIDNAPPADGHPDTVTALREEVARLKAEVARLREELRRARRDQHEAPPHYL